MIWFGRMSAISQLASRVGEMWSWAKPALSLPGSGRMAGRGVAFPPLGDDEYKSDVDADIDWEGKSDGKGWHLPRGWQWRKVEGDSLGDSGKEGDTDEWQVIVTERAMVWQGVWQCHISWQWEWMWQWRRRVTDTERVIVTEMDDSYREGDSDGKGW